MSIPSVHSCSSAVSDRELILERNFEVIYRRCYEFTRGQVDERVMRVYQSGISRVVEMHFWVDTQGRFFFHSKRGESRRQITVCFDGSPYKSLMEIFYRVPGHECRTFPGLLDREFGKATAKVNGILELMRERADQHFTKCAPCRYIAS